MRTLFALGVVTLGLAAAGSAMASDDGDSKHQGRAHHESRASRERSSDDDGSSYQTKRHSERGDRSNNASDSDENKRHGRDGKGERRDGDRS